MYQQNEKSKDIIDIINQLYKDKSFSARDIVNTLDGLYKHRTVKHHLDCLTKDGIFKKSVIDGRAYYKLKGKIK